MATLVANGNAAVISPAYRTDDGEFMHYLSSQNGKPLKRDSRPMVFGPSTVYDSKGEAWESAYWMNRGEHPVENPNKNSKKKWVSKAWADQYIANQKNIERYGGNGRDTDYAGNKSSNSTTRKMASVRANVNTRNAVAGGINKVTGIPGAVGKAAKNSDWGKAFSRATAEYDINNTKFNYDPKYDLNGQNITTEYKGNKLGRTMAGIKGVAGQEASNIRSGAEAARREYERTHNSYDRETGQRTSSGSKLGLTAAMAGGAIGSSAVGRAGKAAFEALRQKAIDAKDAFTKAINKYLTGDGAGTNRKQALQDLQTKAGNMMAAVRQAFGTSEGRAKTLGGITGTASGLAAGIAQSKIGSAAINAGKSAFGAVKDKVGSALSAIGDFFKKKPKIEKPKIEFNSYAKL